MGGGDTKLGTETLHENQSTHMRYQLNSDILLFLMAYWLEESIH